MKKNRTPSLVFLALLSLFFPRGEARAENLFPPLPTAERDALIALYNATGGTAWFNNTKWLGVVGTECEWYGVACAKDSVNPNLSHVTHLYLANNNLIGTLPTTVFNLPYLGTLDLGNNGITGQIPLALLNLPRISVLKLSGNRFSGNIPSELGSLNNLTELWLSNNNLTGAIPPQLGNLSKLTRLDLAANGISGAIPPELGNLTQLNRLDLATNSLTGSIPAALGSLSRLASLLLNRNLLSGDIPSALGSLGSLESLYLQDNNFSGAIPPEFGNLLNLREFRGYRNSFSGPLPSTFGNLAKLFRLHLYENSLSGSLPSNIGNLVELVDLDLHGNQLSGSLPASIGNLTKLYILSLHGNELSGNLPQELGGLTSLVNLYLQNNNLTGPIPAGIGNLGKLKVLNLANNHLTSIPQEIGNLLQLSGPLDLQANAIVQEIPAGMQNLTSLLTGSLDLGYNGFSTTNETLATFLAGKQKGGNWRSTQTVPPTGISVTAVTDNTATLSWTPMNPIGCTGIYEVHGAEKTGGPYVLKGKTTSLLANTLTLTGLKSGTMYYFVVRTISEADGINANIVTSRFSGEVSGKTTGITYTPPVITGQNPLSSPEDTPFTITLAHLKVSDQRGLFPTGFTLNVKPGAGYTVSGATVTPGTNFNGTLSVSVTVHDGLDESATYPLAATITPVNDAPTIAAPLDKTIIQDTNTGPLSFAVGDVDNTPSLLTLSGVSSDTSLVPAGKIVFGGSGASRTVTVTPGTGRTGSAIITLTVSDGSTSNSASFRLTVTEPLGPPWTSGSLLISHTADDGSSIITQTSPTGSFIQKIDTGEDNVGMANLALVANNLFYGSNPTGTVRKYHADGRLISSTIIKSSSTPHVGKLAPDFDDVSLMLVDYGDSGNIIHHLDSFSAGITSFFTSTFFTDNGPIMDLHLGATAGVKTLYALCARDQESGPNRLARINRYGDVAYLDSPSLAMPPAYGIGSVASDPLIGTIYVGTDHKIAQFSPSGTDLGAFTGHTFWPVLAVNDAGDIFAGSEGGIVAVYSSAGRLLRAFRLTGVTKIHDIAIVPGGYAYASAPANPDMDGDGDVDGKDLAAFRQAYASKASTAELNGDGLVDLQDLGVFSVSLGAAP